MQYTASISFSNALTCNPCLVSSLKFVFFSLSDLANKQVATWQGFILQRASLSFRHAFLLTRIDSNGGHGEYSPLDTENTDRSGNVSRSNFILKPEGLTCGCVCQEFSARVLALVYTFQCNKGFY